MDGTVKWFNRKKGYGFVSGDDNEDYFVHYTAVARGTFLKDNDRVSFEPADTDKGKQAQNVNKIGEGAPAPQESAPAEEAPVEAPQDEVPAEAEAAPEPAAEEAPAEPEQEEPLKESS